MEFGTSIIHDSEKLKELLMPEIKKKSREWSTFRNKEIEAVKHCTRSLCKSMAKNLIETRQDELSMRVMVKLAGASVSGRMSVELMVNAERDLGEKGALYHEIYEAVGEILEKMGWI